MAYIGNQPTTVAFLTDQFSGNGSTTAFTLSAAPANTNSILVAVSGVLQDPTTYAVSGTTLTFSAAPPSGTGNISVRFLGIPASGVVNTAYRTQTEFTATAGQTTFSVPSYTPGFIDVYRNGVLLGSTNFTATNGTTVVLANAASAGDLVEVISFSVSSVLNAIPAVANAVTDTYLNTGAVTTTKIADANVTQAKLASGVAGNGPAFSAYMGTDQTVTVNVNTKIAFNTEEYDTASRYNNTGSTVGGIPAYAFLPNVAGYYFINLNFWVGGSTGTYTRWNGKIYKNGSEYSRVNDLAVSGGLGTAGGCLMYLNGTTDYVEAYANIGTSGTAIVAAAGTIVNLFQGYMVRAA